MLTQATPTSWPIEGGDTESNCARVFHGAADCVAVGDRPGFSGACQGPTPFARDAPVAYESVSLVSGRLEKTSREV